MSTRPRIAGRAMAARVPAAVPAYQADWTVLGADNDPVELSQLAYGSDGRQALTTALVAGARNGEVVTGYVVDRRTGEEIIRVPA